MRAYRAAMGRVTVLDGGTGRELARIGAPFSQPLWSAQALIEAPGLRAACARVVRRGRRRGDHHEHLRAQSVPCRAGVVRARWSPAAPPWRRRSHAMSPTSHPASGSPAACRRCSARTGRTCSSASEARPMLDVLIAGAGAVRRPLAGGDAVLDRRSRLRQRRCSTPTCRLRRCGSRSRCTTSSTTASRACDRANRSSTRPRAAERSRRRGAALQLQPTRGDGAGDRRGGDGHATPDRRLRQRLRGGATTSRLPTPALHDIRDDVTPDAYLELREPLGRSGRVGRRRLLRDRPRTHFGVVGPSVGRLAFPLHSGEWRNGRRAGFRCQYSKGCGGSSPPSPTDVMSRDIAPSAAPRLEARLAP